MSCPYESPGGIERVADTEDLEMSSLDKRLYHFVRLPNQLEALLVHDSETGKASVALDCNVAGE